ncbi:MAG: hypothetical protein AAB484_03210, partial [Patescibacteria group bacterium]
MGCFHGVFSQNLVRANIYYHDKVKDMREYEIKVLNINKEQIIKKLERLAAKRILNEKTEIEWYDFQGKDISILKKAKFTKNVVREIYNFLKNNKGNSITKYGGYLRLRKQDGYD